MRFLITENFVNFLLLKDEENIAFSLFLKIFLII